MLRKKYLLTWDSFNSRGGVNHNFKETDTLPTGSAVNEKNFVYVKKKTVNGNEWKPLFFTGTFEVVKLTDAEIKSKGLKRFKTK